MLDPAHRLAAIRAMRTLLNRGVSEATRNEIRKAAQHHGGFVVTYLHNRPHLESRRILDVALYDTSKLLSHFLSIGV
jgi:hypothetical protein